ncbi:hypothetical protein FN846DRAFT_920837 [Sphaerosporella brunnea]|uniref:Reverse transcriptase zinc-binding domain-containing protein n=1 Tax=Sphaerosporella brunnea TaxID=1250544 RepID=A0A5J5ES26_9PEZI|nr:hypothetical protein FN846DRAFT_920837 [Sphaerosporella brunnea]
MGAPSHCGGSRDTPASKAEFADMMAKDAASSPIRAPNEALLRQTSLTHLKRKASVVRSHGTEQWIRQSTSLRASYAPRKKTGFRPALKKERKALASRYYQLLTGHAITAPYLKEKLHKRDSDKCWFCLSGRRRTREHLFKDCDRWLPQIRALWLSMENDLQDKDKRHYI